jgi:hypothetical protein
MELLHIIIVIEEDVKEEEEMGYVLLFFINSQTFFNVVYCSHLNNLNLKEANSVFRGP